MDRKLSKINRYLMIGWLAIVVVLTVTYFGELARGHRDWPYMSMFLTVTIIPAAACLIYFIKNPSSQRLRYYAVAGYLLMYTFVLLNTNTVMTYGYIIPMLSLIVLYHSRRLVLVMGGVALAANIACVVRFFIIGMVTSEDIKDVEIQLGMIIFCFVFAYIASSLYDKIVAENKAYIESIDDKQKQLERVTLQTITTIANIIDAKDEYTKGHSYRVAEYSSALAEELGYDKERVANVKYIGLLHDIGKIGIPDSILNKPGKLTDSEYALMRKHVEIGGNILSGNNMIDGLDEGAKFHHERYDGRGYPLGLKGEEIPEMARIIGIADAYDAMTSNRVYRKRLTNEKVISEMRRCSGAQFDPKLTEIFIKMIESGRFNDLSPDNDTAEESKGIAERSADLLQSVIGFKEKSYDNEHDYLTGVLSRSAGEKLISARLSEGDGGLFIVDITNLLGVNEKHGIVAGDRVLRTVSEALSARDGLAVVRYDGSGFLCFTQSETESGALEKLMNGLCSEICEKLRAIPEYEDNLICVGGALSSDAGRDLAALLIAADKALFYVKQLGEDGCYLYKKSEKGANGRLYGLDLEQLIKMIASGGSDGAVYGMDSPEFERIYELVKGIYEKNKQEMQLVLITVTPAVGKSLAVADRDEAMEYLQSAIDVTVSSSMITFRFSSVQCMVIVTEPRTESAELVTERILNSFYKSYDKKNMALTTEAASLPPLE
ncbi:MAG: HD domain-containing protein [Lachnospiraceae bacterium]|nr:HD domain-containing protein [Ruminococcus sp.]MCM1274385.1 HD domain-containing protein [Lachnospiraceae bacterium]